MSNPMKTGGVEPQEYRWAVEGQVTEATGIVRVRQEIIGAAFDPVVERARKIWNGLEITKVVRVRKEPK